MIQNIIINILMKLKRTTKIENRIMRDRSDKLSQLTEKQYKKFLTWYLNQEYSLNAAYPLAVFSILSKSTTKLSVEEIDEMSIDSKMLNSISKEQVYSFFKSNGYLHMLDLKNFPLLSTYLTSRIGDNEHLIDLLNRGVTMDEDYALRELAGTQDIKLVTSFSKRLTHSVDNENLARQVIASNNYTLQEIKQYFLSTNTLKQTIVDCYATLYNNAQTVEEKKQIIASLLELIETQFLQFSEKEDEEVNTTYEEYAYIINHNKAWTNEMKNSLASKLNETNNHDFIYHWFISDVECDYNFDLIDTMSKKCPSICASLLASVGDKYVDYTYTKIAACSKDKMSEVIEDLCKEIDAVEVSRIDEILAIHYYKNYNFKLSKESALNLIYNGSKYTPKFIDEYELSAEERENILDYYQYNAGFLALYGAYLHSGDRTKLLSKDLIATLTRKKKEA